MNQQSTAEQFQDLMKAISYGTTQIRTKKWNLSDYYEYMAEFFDYIDLPKDADEHRLLAKKWRVENSDK